MCPREGGCVISGALVNGEGGVTEEVDDMLDAEPPPALSEPTGEGEDDILTTAVEGCSVI